LDTHRYFFNWPIVTRLQFPQIAAAKYNFHPTICHLLSMRVAADRGNAAGDVRKLEQFAEMGVGQAHEALAHLPSPASEALFAPKDGTAAMGHLDAALAPNDNDIAILVEKLKLLFAGFKGVT
jgi:hypothetical protein